jgi:hypothetical protein
MKTLVVGWREWANQAAVRDRLPPGQPAIITHEGKPRYLVIRLDQPRAPAAKELAERARRLGLPDQAGSVDVAAALERPRRR